MVALVRLPNPFARLCFVPLLVLFLFTQPHGLPFSLALLPPCLIPALLCLGFHLLYRHTLPCCTPLHPKFPFLGQILIHPPCLVLILNLRNLSISPLGMALRNISFGCLGPWTLHQWAIAAPVPRMALPTLHYIVPIRAERIMHSNQPRLLSIQ